MTFTDIGLPITVNGGNPLTLVRGTYSSTIAIQIANPSTLNLTLKATSDRITVIPPTIYLLISQKQTTFTVTAPITLLEGSYFIYWETLGDSNPVKYAPIQKTVIVVQAAKVAVVVNPIQDVPIGGWSLPFTVEAANPPNSDITVSLALDPAPSGFAVNQNSFKILAGYTASTFFITSGTSDPGVASFKAKFSLSGTDVSAFQLSTAEVTVSVIRKAYF